MSGLRRWAGVVAGGVIVAAAAILGATLPASAEAPPARALLVSSDGVTFGDAWTGPLFASSPVLVPGGAASATVYAKNGTSSAADFTAALSGLGDSAIDMTVRAGGNPTGGNPASGLAVGPVRLAPGAVLPLIVSVSLPGNAGNGAQGITADIGLTLTLRGETIAVPVLPPGFETPEPPASTRPTAPSVAPVSTAPAIDVRGSGSSEAAVPTGGSSADVESNPGGSPDSDALSYTGMATVRYLLIGGVALLLGFALLLIARRRRSPHH